MPNIPLDRTISRFCNSYAMIFGRKTSPSEGDEQLKGEKCLNTMRQSFHRALTTCRAPLPPGKKYVAVQFLSKEVVFYVVDAKGKGQEVFDEASKHLGLLDTELFGLAFYQDGDYIFVDLNLKVSKYAVRGWKTQNNGVGCDGQPSLVLHMRVKYYVDCHLLISEKVVRHHYYLQLRENVKNYSQSISEEKSFLLAALALQADLGNYDEENHKEKYFEIVNYFPSWIVAKIGEDYIVRNIPALHKDNAGLSRGEAQVGYIKEASDVTAPHNMHFYRMRRRKGKSWSSVWLGIRDSGLHIYEQPDPEGTKSLLSVFLWCDIAKLHFEKKKFEILSEGSPEYRRFTYFAQSEDLAKNLLWICRTTHHFHMANQNRVADLKKLELDGGKPYRESYIYTDKSDQDWEKKQNSTFKNKLKSKVDNSTVNFNGMDENSMGEKSLKPVNKKLFGMPWNNVNGLNGNQYECQSVPVHLSMEALPLVNGSKFSSELKYKSQSISCFSDRSLAPKPVSDKGQNTSIIWNPGISSSTTPTSTLMSRSSCASNTDSTCSTLSLTSSSTVKLENASRCSNDGSHWVKCDSFEELPVDDLPQEKVMHKVCISTFVDKHVRTASVYDAVSIPKSSKPPSFTTTSPNSSSQTKSNYVTSSLGAVTSSGRVIDVKRSPSLNVASTSENQCLNIVNKKLSYDSNMSAQKPLRQYATNTQNHITPHARTATRIGVSSLSRDQRLPLTLFNDQRILACGSEPNLYAPPSDSNPVSVSDAIQNSQWTQRKMNSRSEMCLNNVIEGQRLRSPVQRECQSGDSRPRHLSLPDVCNSDVVDGEFPCIPPPPAYRNEVGHSPPAQFQLKFSSNERICLPTSPETHKELRTTHSSPPDVLDIQQLRQRSRDLDLPLISALCNDRSLLMLPKTVPTCSRQRHLGSKDPLRFNRATSLPNGDSMADVLFPNGGRPTSWHVESGQQQAPWLDSKQSASSWDIGFKALLPPPAPMRIEKTIVPSLPPTILTSFGKTPAKPIRTVHDQSNSDSYRYNKIQMIPTKLLAGLAGVPNGRLYQKGQSS